MEILLAILGAVLIALALLDLFVTVLTTRGGGPISSRLGSVCWRLMLALHGWRGSHRILGYAGALIAVLTVLGWTFLFWACWLLIFSAGPDSIVRATTGEPADLWARIYFSGYTLFTLGLGDYRPKGALWQLLTALAVGNGFMVISVSASYLIPLVSAATSKRSIALHIRTLGVSPSEILVRAWDGSSLSGLAQHLVALSPTIIQAGQQHLVYPVLHYFQSADAESALPVQVARLSEALDLLEYGLAPQARLPAGITRPTREAIGLFGRLAQQPEAQPAAEAPPEPDLEPLRRAGIPVVSEAEYRDAVARRREERRAMFAFVQYSGWSWEYVTERNED